ncbi:MAG: AraC family transcriptional regulator [Algoriphagus sp.]|jgi:AraC-like DNA-binding protein|uniref:AraC family transcriptional regulator n=1 Tax=Algoriphagus sp. TaxID=1872435 RepID=UPI00260A4F67|nr:AraC family transcriptional regulator [Algoriphagus sp.]MDG1277762.1 AraC family transcriptional regulator [Algoriphagus sp.]
MAKAPLLQKLPISKGNSFLAHRFESPYFETPWHYHEEFEILLCDGGWGKKYVGNHLSEYKEGDVLFLGSNLPHWFAADESIYIEKKVKPASIVIQFTKIGFGESFFELEEMNKIQEMLQNSANGLEFFGTSREKFAHQIKSILEKRGVKRFLSLVMLLEDMSRSEESSKLTLNPVLGRSSLDSPRMDAILQFLSANFSREIRLEEVADLVQMSPAGFCRYLKSRTQKTLIELVNDFRINQACKLLHESDMKVVEVCYEVGFSNLSNFNRQFRKLTKMSPKEYRNSR